MIDLASVLADQSAVNCVAMVILVSRFYDCEPEMYESKEAFCAKMIADGDHMFEAQFEARAAINAMIAETQK